MSIDDIIPDDLVKKIKERDCVLFVGSGLSRPELPDWKGLLTRMVNWGRAKLTTEKLVELEKHINENKLLLVAGAMREKMGKQDFHNFMLDTFRGPKLIPNENHKLITQIPFRSVITTNYDVLLESEYKPKPPVFTHTRKAELSEYLHNNSFYIFKAHGDIDDIETVILGRQDYRELLKNSAYIEHLKVIFDSRTVLFVGYSLTDYDMMLLLDDLNTTFKGYTARHYALICVDGVSSVEMDEFVGNYNIQIIPYKSPNKDHHEVTEFLTELKRRCQEDEEMISQELPDLLDVFVAKVSDPLRSRRQKIINQLRLLKPEISVYDKEIPPPYGASDHENAVKNALKNSRLSIHLLDNYTGDEIQDEGETYIQKQAELGFQYAQSQLVWIPRTLDLANIEDERQKSLIEKLKTGRDKNYEFLPGNPEEDLMDIVKREIEKCKKEPVECAEVFFDTYVKDRQFALKIADSLLEKKVNTFISWADADPRSNINLLKERLQRAIALIIIYGSVNEDWILNRLTVISKVVVDVNILGKLLLYVYLAPPEKDKKIDYFLNPRLFKNPRSLDSRGGFDSVLQTLYSDLGV